MKNETCIFCKIVKNQIPADIIHKTKTTLTFLDINPTMPGHLLVIPKKHYEWMQDVPDSLITDVYTEAKKLMKALIKSMGADYVTLTVVGKDVPHFHVHLLPRYYNDGLKPWPAKKYKPGEKEIVAAKIKKAVR
jgi:histidine triad (HIT) family protein